MAWIRSLSENDLCEHQMPNLETPPQPKERVLWNTIAMIIARAISDAFGMLATFIMARHLSNKEWGLFGYLRSSIEIFRVVTNFGSELVSLRIMALGTRSPQQIVRHLNILKTVLVTIGFAILAGLSFSIDGFEQHRGLLFLLAIVLFPEAYSGSLGVRFQAEHAMEKVIPIQFITGALFLAAVYVAAMANCKIGAFIAICVGIALVNLFLIKILSRWTWKVPAVDQAPPRFDPGF
ncbi:MAG: hypothetical protein V1754_00970, partial [Pseudomonadota bacterium]